MKKGLIVLLVLLLILVNMINFIIIATVAPVTGRATSAEGTVSICINYPPNITAIAAQTATVGQAFSFQVDASDNEGNTLTYTDNTSLFAIGSSTGLIGFTPSSGEVGTYTILITVADDSGCATNVSTTAFTLTISVVAEGASAPGGGGGGGGAAPAAIEFTLPFAAELGETALGEGGKNAFTFGGEEHQLKVAKIGKDYARIVLTSQPQEVVLYVGESREIDLDDDGTNDLYLRLEAIKYKKAFFVTKSLRAGFKLSEEIIKVGVRQSQSLEKAVTLSNDWGGDLEVQVDNLQKVWLISPGSFLLPKNQERGVTFTFNPEKSSPGIYPGLVAFRAHDAQDTFIKYVTVVLEITSDEVLFDVSLDLLKKTLPAGENLEATVSIFNPRPVALDNVTLVYAVLDLNQSTIWESKETVSLSGRASFSQVIPLPAKMAPGQYLLSLKVIYQSSVMTAAELFTVESPAPPAPLLVGLAAPLTQKSAFLVFVPAILILVVLLAVVLYYVLQRRARGLRVVVRQKTIVQPKVVWGKDWGRWRRKLSLLKESYEKGYIQKETYRKARESLEKLMKK